MRKSILALAGAAQLLAAPLQAAALSGEGHTHAQQPASFAGFRARLALGGRDGHQLRAGLVAGPVIHGQALDGRSSTRFGDALELGIVGNRRPGLLVAGMPIGEAGRVPGGRRAGVSTVGWVAIGVGALAALYVGAILTCTEITDCFDDDE